MIDDYDYDDNCDYGMGVITDDDVAEFEELDNMSDLEKLESDEYYKNVVAPQIRTLNRR